MRDMFSGRLERKIASREEITERRGGSEKQSLTGAGEAAQSRSNLEKKRPRKQVAGISS